MKKLKRDWCSEGNCPCPVSIFMKQAHCGVNITELAQEVRESEARVLNCLKNLMISDKVCQDGNLWCPDNL